MAGAAVGAAAACGAAGTARGGRDVAAGAAAAGCGAAGAAAIGACGTTCIAGAAGAAAGAGAAANSAADPKNPNRAKNTTPTTSTTTSAAAPAVANPPLNAAKDGRPRRGDMSCTSAAVSAYERGVSSDGSRPSSIVVARSDSSSATHSSQPDRCAATRRASDALTSPSIYEESSVRTLACRLFCQKVLINAPS